jgi:alpha-galactosidase
VDRKPTIRDRNLTLLAQVSPTLGSRLTSFSLGGIGGQLRVHRFRSGWSAEGRHDVQTLEQLHLEKSWAGLGAFSERFGQVGTLPVRKWFPFVAVEDVQSGILWGAQLAWAGSWQLEIYRRRDDVCISGGLADRELGHWTCRLEPGEALEAPPAIVACVSGGLDELCDAFTSSQPVSAPAIESELPIVFNEWCTSWGEPSHDKAVALAERLSGTPVRYLVIDAGGAGVSVRARGGAAETGRLRVSQGRLQRVARHRYG